MTAEPVKPAPSEVSKEERIRVLTEIILRNIETWNINGKRINTFIVMAEKLGGPIPDELKLHRDDLLRAAVVFLHASVEELLRGLAVIYLPACDEEALNQVPLAGSADTLRAEKFFLGRLAKHRGKTVDDLIAESVKEHVSRRTFNDTADIVRLFGALKIEVDAEFKDKISKINDLIARRHQIVHRADITERKQKPTPIDAKTVRGWLDSVHEFVAYVAAIDVVKSVAQWR